MRVSADVARCEGHGLCAEAAPAVYGAGDGAVVSVRYEELPPELERLAEAGARMCPVAVLKVIR